MEETTSPEDNSMTQSRILTPVTASILSNYTPIPPKGTITCKSDASQTNPPATSAAKIHFKLNHSGYTRRFAISKDGDLLSDLRANIHRITGTNDGKVFWRDEESLNLLECFEDLEAAVDFALRQSGALHNAPCVTLEFDSTRKEEEETEQNRTEEDLSVERKIKEEDYPIEKHIEETLRIRDAPEELPKNEKGEVEEEVEEENDDDEDFDALSEEAMMAIMIEEPAEQPKRDEQSALDSKEEENLDGEESTVPEKTIERVADYLEMEVINRMRINDGPEKVEEEYIRFLLDYYIDNVTHNIEKTEERETVFTTDKMKDDKAITRIANSLLSRLQFLSLFKSPEEYIDYVKHTISSRLVVDDQSVAKIYEDAAKKLKLRLLAFSPVQPIYPTDNSSSRYSDEMFSKLKQFVAASLEIEVITHLKAVALRDSLLFKYIRFLETSGTMPPKSEGPTDSIFFDIVMGKTPTSLAPTFGQAQDSIFSFQKDQENEKMTAISEALHTRLWNMWKYGKTDERLVWLKEMIRTELTQYSVEEVAAFSFAAKKLKSILLKYSWKAGVWSPNTVKTSPRDSEEMEEPKTEEVFDDDNMSGGRRVKRRMLPNLTPLNPKQEDYLKQIVDTGSFNLAEDYDRLVEVCRIAGNFDDAWDLILVELEQKEALSCMFMVDIRVPLLIEYDIIDDLIKIANDKVRLRICQAYISNLEKMSQCTIEKEKPLIARSIVSSLRYTMNNLTRLHRRQALLDTEFLQDGISDIDALRRTTKELKRCFVIEYVAPVTESSESSDRPSVNQRGFNDQQRTVLTKLLELSCFKDADYNEMVEVARTAGNLEEAIEMMTQLTTKD